MVTSPSYCKPVPVAFILKQGAKLIREIFLGVFSLLYNAQQKGLNRLMFHNFLQMCSSSVHHLRVRRAIHPNAPNLLSHFLTPRLYSSSILISSNLFHTHPFFSPLSSEAHSSPVSHTFFRDTTIFPSFVHTSNILSIISFSFLSRVLSPSPCLSFRNSVHQWPPVHIPTLRLSFHVRSSTVSSHKSMSKGSPRVIWLQPYTLLS